MPGSTEDGSYEHTNTQGSRSLANGQTTARCGEHKPTNNEQNCGILDRTDGYADAFAEHLPISTSSIREKNVSAQVASRTGRS